MHYYKFRVYYDEIEDFTRDIEILATDTFEAFHKILYSSIGLKGNELASFAICDSKWNKQKEITLLDMQDDMEMQESEYNEEDSFSTRASLPKFVMSESVLNKFITDPHQHIMYEYDFLHPKVFYIELLKALQTDEAAEKFPRCTHAEKELPKESPKLLDDPDDNYMEDLLLAEEEDDEFEDGFNDEDLTSFDEFTGEY